YDQETGLYYNRYRYFDPELGQYISSDPIGFAGGLRPQGYVHNPLEWVDPLGLAGCPQAKNKKTSYDGKSRRDAFRQAKRDAGIPMSQQPKSITRPDLEDGYGNKVLGADGMPVKTRQYEFLNTKGESVFIQEHSLGHSKATPQHGLEPHFNVRPADPVTGLAIDNKTPSNVHGHYNFLKK
ncbi:HNH/endonuclease VII fold putative polymorphic toxin, partial [Aeromonas salmonicida]